MLNPLRALTLGGLLLFSTLGHAAPAAPLLQLQQGDMVEHTAFGKGMVLSVRPMGGDALAEVAFDTVGKKKLMLKSAGAHMRKL
jgi:DNA helicase-2/ATP-dependent DNA helicase PcrA